MILKPSLLTFYFTSTLLNKLIGFTSISLSNGLLLVTSRKYFAWPLDMIQPKTKTMGESLAKSLGDVPEFLSACPCCSFIPSTLFLPPSEINTNGNVSFDFDKSKSMTEVEHSSSLSPSFVHSLEKVMTQLNKLPKQELLIVDTHSHPHLNREPMVEYDFLQSHRKKDDKTKIKLISLICAITPNDWATTLEYASTSSSTLPALGVHPWYIETSSLSYLQDLESLLLQHPSALVGEIGLCKSAKNIRCHPDGKAAGLLQQKQFFVDQLKLAARLQRGVTIHCVGYHTVLLDVLKMLREEALKEYLECNANISSKSEQIEDMESQMKNVQGLRRAFPPVMSFHSFSGTASFVKEILILENSILHPESQPSEKTREKKGNNLHGLITITTHLNLMRSHYFILDILI